MGIFSRKQVTYHVYPTFVTPSGGYNTGCRTFNSQREARKAAEIINKHEHCVGVVCYDGDIKIDGNQAKVVFRLGASKP